MTEGWHIADQRLRRERWVVVCTLLGMALPIPGLVALQWYLGDRPGPVELFVAGVLATVAAALALWMVLRRVLAPHDHALPPGQSASGQSSARGPGPGAPARRERSPALFLPSFAALVTAVWILLPEGATVVVPAMWWGMVALVVPRWWSALSGVVLLVLPWVYDLLTGGVAHSPLWTLLVLALGWGLLVGNWMTLRLWDLSREVVAGQRARSRLAASEERVRIARDIHDLLGHSLSGIAVRSELAARLTEVDTARAAAEMRAVQDEARGALREVRSTVSGYRDADLTDELEGAREVLAATGVRLTVTGRVEEVPDHLRSTAAWVVREGVTNIVRHSAARRCAILLEQDGAALTLRIRNDGVGSDPGHVNGGSGILGLTQRVTATGGTLAAGHAEEGRFELRAVLPTRVATLLDGHESDEEGP